MATQDLFALLRQDHEKVSRMITQLKAEKNSSLQKKLFSEVRDELELHSSAEEETVYLNLEDMEVTQELVAEAEDQHTNIRECLETLDCLDPQDGEWPLAVDTLEGTVTHHVEMEESKIFDAIKKWLNQKGLDDTRDAFVESKRQLQKELAA